MFTKDIREKFLQYHQDADLKKWFDPLALNYAGSELAPADLLVEFPHRLFADWWAGLYRDKFERTLLACLGRKPEIAYTCPGVSMPGQTGRNLAAGGQGKTHLRKPAALPALTLEAESKEPEQTFENFIFNRKNQFPAAAAQNFAKNGGQAQAPVALQNSPFILFGPGGCGKTHLLRAIYHEVKKNIHEKIIILNNLSELEIFVAKALQNTQSTLSYLRNFACILIEDLDMAESLPDLQAKLVTLFEAARESGVKIGLSLKRNPGALPFINEKLRSLLEAGLSIELKRPDMDVRRQYVDYLAGRLNLRLKKEDSFAIARIYNSFSQIYGAMLKVSSFLILSPQAADAKLADILQSSQSGAQKRLTPDHIIASVAEYFKMSPAEITGKRRTQRIVLARHLSIYFCRELLGAQLGHIGACFSDMDHSSVLYSVNKIKKMIAGNKDTHNLATEVRNIISK